MSFNSLIPVSYTHLHPCKFKASRLRIYIETTHHTITSAIAGHTTLSLIHILSGPACAPPCAQDLAAIDTAMAEINTAFQAASAEMYAQSGAQGGAQAGPDMNGGAGQQDNSKHGDNVQDADFEEVH